MTNDLSSLDTYEQRKEALLRGLASSRRAPIRLAKGTSNLFRDRSAVPAKRLDVSAFDHVLDVSPEAGWVDVEGMTTYETLVDGTLAHGLMPLVVPQLKTITIGGAAAGVGIEATSFRHGLVHHTLREMEVLLGDGSVVLCSPDNEHSDLFFGFPNSYGTLGYALRVRAETQPVRRYVQVEHDRFDDVDAYFHAVEERVAGDADFLDGVVFGPRELYLSVGRFVDEAPWTSDYTYQRIYYRSVQERRLDYLATSGYLWRWDTDWFWCSKNLYAQNPLVRRLYGARRLNSATYTRIMRWNSRWQLTRRLDRLRGLHPESVIQDVDIPLERAAEFLAFLHRDIRILPIWVCPIRAPASARRFDLYPMNAERTYVNVGFWDVVKATEPHPPGHFNRLIEKQVQQLGGIKSLYSDSYFAADEFWRIYNKPAYDRLKATYDPDGLLGDLYEKCVLRR